MAIGNKVLRETEYFADVQCKCNSPIFIYATNVL